MAGQDQGKACEQAQLMWNCTCGVVSALFAAGVCVLLLYLSAVGFNGWQREGLVWGLGEQL